MTLWPPYVYSIGGLGVLAIRGPKAGRKTRKWFGDFPMFRNIRLASFDEFVTLGFHVFVLLVALGVFVNCRSPGRVSEGRFLAKEIAVCCDIKALGHIRSVQICNHFVSRSTVELPRACFVFLRLAASYYC